MLRNGMNITNKKELREVIVRLEILWFTVSVADWLLENNKWFEINWIFSWNNVSINKKVASITNRNNNSIDNNDIDRDKIEKFKKWVDKDIETKLKKEKQKFSEYKYVKKSIKAWELRKMHGTEVIFKTNNWYICEWKISVRDTWEVYVCHNNKNAIWLEAKNFLWYNYSWLLYLGNDREENSSVDNRNFEYIRFKQYNETEEEQETIESLNWVKVWDFIEPLVWDYLTIKDNIGMTWKWTKITYKKIIKAWKWIEIIW
jgi:hypothetical protein